jgi:uncharacterized membrane protein YdjX (TVP38/TMEM64 family)
MKATCLLLVTVISSSASAFLPASLVTSSTQRTTSRILPRQLFNNDNEGKDEATVEEEGRLRVWESRRGQIRSALKTAESIRINRIANGWVPELDEDGKPLKADGKVALTMTAFVVATGAIALRIGGRAALVSVVGLDFLTDNPELQNQVAQVLSVSEAMDPLVRLALFSLAWTVIKVFCFDAGAVVLALASGILFGGVLQGAVVSAFGATVGSSVAFALAKLDTPVRAKALEVVEKNPSLKGIERVVAEDGLKAILTLRLAPILPIPIGLYNYVYGVTNVPYFDFAGGIFLGSLKPYLLDSYLGYFGKEVINGTAGKDGGLQDILLLVAIGFSVSVGVFASQLAGETWDAILQEDEASRKKKIMEPGNENNEEGSDKIMREVFGVKLPQWVVGFQLALRDADYRINSLILQEFNGKVWNYTDSRGDNPVPPQLDPAYWAGSPEVTGAYKGVDLGALTCDGLVLSPALFTVGLKIADPLFKEDEFIQSMEEQLQEMASLSTSAQTMATGNQGNARKDARDSESPESSQDDMLLRLRLLRDRTTARIGELDKRKEANVS